MVSRKGAKISNKTPRFIRLVKDDCYINSQLPLTHYNNRTNKAHYIGRLKVKKGLRLFKLTSELIGTCHLVVKFDDKPSVGRPIKTDRDMAIRLYQALELAQARIRDLEQAALWQTEREGHHGIGGTAGRGEAFAPPQAVCWCCHLNSGTYKPWWSSMPSTASGARNGRCWMEPRMRANPATREFELARRGLWETNDAHRSSAAHPTLLSIIVVDIS